MEFPQYKQYVELLAQRDQGVLMVAIIAFAGVMWLWLGRFSFPRLLPYLRAATLLLFFTTLVFALFGEVGK